MNACEWKWVQSNAGALHGGYRTSCGHLDEVNNPHSPCIYCGCRIIKSSTQKGTEEKS